MKKRHAKATLRPQGFLGDAFASLRLCVKAFAFSAWIQLATDYFRKI
jgi:hypothetical protein